MRRTLKMWMYYVEKPDKILREISKYYKIIWSAPNLTSGVTASIWDADNRQIFRIDLVKNLCLITERTYPLRLRSTLTIDDMDKPQNLENFRNLRKKIKKLLTSHTIDQIVDLT